jgi:UDP-glucuronate decarboxylase
MRRVVIAGGAGFIGLNLVRRLLADGARVMAIDMTPGDQIRHFEPFIASGNFEYRQQDIIEPITIDGPVQEIYNLATTAAPKYYQADRVHTLKTCVFGSTNLLDLAAEKGARILQSSTSEVYGDPLEHPQKESYRGNVNPTGPRACYDEGKRAAEALFMDYHRHRATDIKIIRIFNCYGPYMKDDGRIMSNFIQQALKGEPITIYGDGLQTRSFMYIDDLVDGIVRMMQVADFTGPVNLGNPEEHTVKEIAETVVRLTKSKSEIRYHPLPQDDPTRRQPDITLAGAKLGWKPTVDLEAGLMKTIGFYTPVAA